MVLQYPSFQIDFVSFNAYLKSSVPDADGIFAEQTQYTVVEKVAFTQSDINLVNSYVNGLTAAGEQAKIAARNAALPTQYNTYEATATSTTTTTTNVPGILDSMTLNPSAGTYMAMFSTSLNSNNAGAAIALSLYNGGTQDPNTVRYISPFDGGALSATSANGAVTINKVITVTAGSSVSIYWSTGGGTATCAARTLTLVRIG